MNKKILAILSLVILAIVCTGSVSALDLGSMLGWGDSSSDGGKITIDGVDFNIPAGFEEAKDQAMDNETEDNSDITTITNGKTFTKGDDEVISIGVATYVGYEVNDTIAEYVGDEKLSINGVDGYSYGSGIFDGFVYANDGKLVIITTTNETLLDEVVAS